MADDAAWTRSPVLQGGRVRLEPLDERHVPGLLAAAADPATWTWLFEPLDKETALRAWLADALRARDAGTVIPFATLDATTGRVEGSTRYMAIVPAPSGPASSCGEPRRVVRPGRPGGGSGRPGGGPDVG